MHSRHFSLTPRFSIDMTNRNVRYLPKRFRYYSRYWFLLIVSTDPVTRVKKKCYKIYCLIANIYFWVSWYPCTRISFSFFLFLAHFSLIPRYAFGISYARNMSIDIIERFCQRTPGRRRDKYVSKHDDRAIYYSVGGKGSPSPACISIADKPTRERNAGFTLAIRCFSMSTLDLSSGQTHKGNNLCSKNKFNKLRKQKEKERKRERGTRDFLCAFKAWN